MSIKRIQKKNLILTLRIFFTNIFYVGTLRTLQHIVYSYCEHRSRSQNVHRTRDIITPPHQCAFRSTSLSFTILVQLAYISLPFISHRTSVHGWHSLRPMYKQHWVTPIPPPNGPGTADNRIEPKLIVSNSIAITRQSTRLPPGVSNNPPFATSIRGSTASKPHASEKLWHLIHVLTSN